MGLRFSRPRLERRRRRPWTCFVSRYLKVAESWPGQIGLAESDLMRRLPADLINLESLARLTRAQLEDVLDRLGVKHAGRAAVNREVRAVLNQPPATSPVNPGDKLLKVINRHIRAALAAADELHKQGIDPQVRGQLLTTVNDGVAKIRDALQADPLRVPPDAA